MNQPENSFDFFVSTNSPFLVATFVGEMTKDSLERLKECEQKILSEEQAKYFILYFRDVSNITVEVVPFLTSLQQAIRKKGELRLCSFKPEVKEKLIKLGIVRGLELTDNLQTTLHQLKNS